MDRLSLVPSSSSYSASPTAGYLRVALQGGPGRYRGDSQNNAVTFNCTWFVGEEDYQYLAAFYRVFEREQSTFLVSLAFESSELEDYYAKVIPDSWSLGESRGLSYTVSCQLEATPANPRSADFDTALVGLRASYANPDLFSVLNLLDQLVNHDIPEVA